MPPVNCTVRGAGTGEEEGAGLTSSLGAGAAAGMGDARGRSEDCGVVDGTMGESVRVEMGISAA